MLHFCHSLPRLYPRSRRWSRCAADGSAPRFVGRFLTAFSCPAADFDSESAAGSASIYSTSSNASSILDDLDTTLVANALGKQHRLQFVRVVRKVVDRLWHSTRTSYFSPLRDNPREVFTMPQLVPATPALRSLSLDKRGVNRALQAKLTIAPPRDA